jgi:hypothetical protein
MITPKIADLTGEDLLALRAFLDSPAGTRFFPQLLDGVPSLLDGADVNKSLVRMGEVRGWQEALKRIISLAYPPEPLKPEPVMYPSLVDDSAWSDGQKIEPQK